MRTDADPRVIQAAAAVLRSDGYQALTPRAVAAASASSISARSVAANHLTRRDLAVHVLQAIVPVSIRRAPTPEAFVLALESTVRVGDAALLEILRAARDDERLRAAVHDLLLRPSRDGLRVVVGHAPSETEIDALLSCLWGSLLMPLVLPGATPPPILELVGLISELSRRAGPIRMAPVIPLAPIGLRVA